MLAMFSVCNKSHRCDIRTQSSEDDLATLTALRRAVKNALERKRRLGQYAVVWRDGKPALLDEDVEDRAAFYEAMSKEPVTY